MYDTVTQVQSNYSATVCVDIHRLPKGTVHVYMYDTVAQVKSNYSAMHMQYVWTPIGYLKVQYKSCMYDTVTQVQSNYSATVCADTHRLPKGTVHVCMIRSSRYRVTIVPQYVWTPIGFLKVQYIHTCMIQSPRYRVTIVPQYICADTHRLP